MFCSKCGTKLPDDAEFCAKCGAKTGARKNKQDEEKKSVYSPKTVNSNKNALSIDEKTKKRIKAISAMVLIAGIILFFGIFVFLKLRKTTINLNDYVDVTYEGYDGLGNVNISFNTDKFIRKNRERIHANKNLRNMIKEHDDLKAIADSEDIKYSQGKDVALLFARIYGDKGAVSANDLENANNGDVILYSWDLATDDMTAEEAIKFARTAFNVKLIADDTEYEVKGLKKVKKFDAFENVELEFKGIAPEGTADIKQSPDKNGLSYKLDKKGGLSNGDIVTVTADFYGNVEDYVEEYKRLPEEMTREYTVAGLESYLTDVSEITGADLDILKEDCEDVITKNVSGASDKYVSLDHTKFNSAYLLTKKENRGGGDYNKIVVIYEVGVEFSSEKAETEKLDYYFYISYPNVLHDSDGKLQVNLNSRDVVSTTFDYSYEHKMGWWGMQMYYIRGFEDFDSLYRKAIVENSENYNCEQIPSGE